MDFVVVANRLPVDEVSTPDGREWRPSPGGLVTALQPILARRGGPWVGLPCRRCDTRNAWNSARSAGPTCG